MTIQRDSEEKNSALLKYAELEIARYGSSIDSIVQQHADDFKFITSSLMLINSGAAVAILNSENITVLGKQLSGAACIVGLLFALAVAWLNQKVVLKPLVSLNAARAFWVSIAAGNPFSETEVEKIGQQLSASNKGSWIVPAMGWLSVLSFCVAAGVAGSHLTDDNPQSRPQVNVSAAKSAVQPPQTSP